MPPPKKNESWRGQVMGSAEKGGPIKLRFRADQHDFAGFFHAFFPAHFLQEYDAKFMQDYAMRIDAWDKGRTDRDKRDRMSVQNEIWGLRRRQGAADLATPISADPSS